MKKIFFGLIMILFALACNNKSNNTQTPKDSVANAINTSNADSTIVMPVPVAQPVDTSQTSSAPTEEKEINYSDSINFAKFHTDISKSHIAPAPIDWSSYPGARDFKTRITESYKTTEVSFAGHYVLSTFGCGASCIMGFMVDVRDGKIYDLPLGEENSCLFAEDAVLCKSSSRLFVSGVCKENHDDKQVYYKAYLWNEDKKEFAPIKADEFLNQK
ncbi:MAG: hypothetical protein EOP55_20185 [Sphingobacteriales bacterium]|nr:MAG: hypothetical protein EOP55_20185 [Sphingobacteriales bacterium]